MLCYVTFYLIMCKCSWLQNSLNENDISNASVVPQIWPIW